jgi:hypothetical protein
MSHICIPATQEAEMGGSKLKANPGKKLSRPHLNKPSEHGGWCL